MAHCSMRPLVNVGAIRGAIYDFEHESDILPMHGHTEADAHITIVARGSFRIHGPTFDQTYKAGDVVDFAPGLAHEFISLEPNSRIINLIKAAPPG